MQGSALPTGHAASRPHQHPPQDLHLEKQLCEVPSERGQEGPSGSALPLGDTSCCFSPQPPKCATYLSPDLLVFDLLISGQGPQPKAFLSPGLLQGEAKGWVPPGPLDSLLPVLWA